MLQEIAGDLLLFLGALLAGWLIQACLFLLVIVKGSSMENTLRSRDVVFVSRLGRYRRGDVVICRFPRRADGTVELGPRFQLVRRTLFVKRLVALPGDTLEIREQTLFVNGEPVPDPVGMKTPPRDMAVRTLRKDECFVMGDNRANSHDSRAHGVGPLPLSALQGRVKRIVWPLNRMGRVR